MKSIPKPVMLSWLLCAGCFVLGGILRLCADELAFVAQVLSVLGMLAVGAETFRWGAREGYVIIGRPITSQIEHTMRCIAMSACMVVAAAFLSGAVLQSLFELFWRA